MPEDRRPAGSTRAGRPARFHADTHGAHRALAATLADQPRSCQGRAASGGPVTTGVSRTSTPGSAVAADPANQPVTRDRNRSASAGRSRPARRTHRPSRACARVRGCSAPGCSPRCSASAAAPANQRTSTASPADTGTGGSRRTTVWPIAVSRAATASSAARPSASSRAPGTGVAVDSATVRAAPSSSGGSVAAPSARTACASARSATVVASAPFSAMPDQESAPSCAGTTPRPGLRVTRPHAAAGSRSEPSPSLPWASGTPPDATAAALPPDEPAGDSAVSQGLRLTVPGPSVVANTHSSGTRVRPTTTAPAARSRATTGWSAAAGGPPTTAPSVVTSPATATLSLTATGTPASGSRARSGRASTSAASASAASVRSTR